MDNNQCQGHLDTDDKDGNDCIYSLDSIQSLQNDSIHDSPAYHEISHPLPDSPQPQSNPAHLSGLSLLTYWHH